MLNFPWEIRLTTKFCHFVLDIVHLQLECAYKQLNQVLLDLLILFHVVTGDFDV